MVRGVSLVLAFCFSFQARAEFSGIQALLAPALIGVTNRRLDSEYQKDLKLDPRATVALFNTEGEGLCTARFLNPTTALLAAHCLLLPKTKGVLNVDGVDSLKYYYSSHENPANDIALVVFPEGTGEFLEIEDYAPVVATPFEKGRSFIVGFGKDSEFDSERNCGAGVKGWGEFNVVGRKDGLLVTEEGYYSSAQKKNGEPAGKKVVGLQGDSGASVYNEQGEIIAVVTQRALDVKTEVKNVPETFLGFITGREVEVEVNTPTGAHNHLVDITSENSRKVFRDAILCKEPPCAANFVGSGVSEVEAPVRLASLQPVDDRLFKHRVLRTGRYHSKDSDKDLYLHSSFDGNRLKYVRMHVILDENEVSPMIPLICDKHVCMDGGYNSIKLENPENNVVVVTGKRPGEKEIMKRYELVPE